jgi:hypothetical protein
VTTSPYGTVVTRQVDRRRGVVFEIQSSTPFDDGGLYVKLTLAAPASTRRGCSRGRSW